MFTKFNLIMILTLICSLVSLKAQASDANEAVFNKIYLDHTQEIRNGSFNLHKKSQQHDSNSENIKSDKNIQQVTSSKNEKPQLSKDAILVRQRKIASNSRRSHKSISQKLGE